MYSKIRKRFGTAGLVVAIVALIAALAGGAYAASGGLTSKQKKEVKSIAKSFQGSGPTGPAGPQGSPGAPGKDGSSGSSGKDGASVTVEEFGGEKEGHCFEGGSKFTVGASKAFACNGEEGVEGSPWTAGGTLPSAKTETGVWTVGRLNDAEVTPEALVAISFPVPLAAPIQGGHMHYLAANGKEIKFNAETFEIEEVTSTACLGTAADPKATAGNFCAYTGFLNNAKLTNINFADLSGNLNIEESETLSYTTGTTLSVRGNGVNEPIKGIGTWAVTAP